MFWKHGCICDGVDFAEFFRMISVAETLDGRKVERLESQMLQEWLMDRRVGSDRTIRVLGH